MPTMILTATDIILFSSFFLLLFLSIFWLLVLFMEEDPQRIRKKQRKWKVYPSFTAIVPAYNEEEHITGTLASLANLDYPAEKMQLIVVDDGSTDKTAEKVKEFIAANPAHNPAHNTIHSILLLQQKNQGKGNALNHGLRYATGEFYACLDADSFVSPNALKEMLPHFEDANVAAVCPLLKVKQPDSLLRKVQWHEYLINMFYKFLNARLDCIHVTPGPFSVYRTAVIQKLGGYDEKTITEDLEIAMRLQKNQYKLVQTFDALVETVAPNRWRELFRQRVRWYKGSIDNGIVYRKLMFNRTYGDFGFVRMPTIFLAGIVVLVLSGALLRELLTNSYRWFKAMQAINFDLITLLKNFSFSFHFLSLPFAKIFVALMLFSLSIFVMILSYKLVRERISNYGRTWVSLVTYLFIYGLFLSVVWVYIGFLLVSRKKSMWKAARS